MSGFCLRPPKWRPKPSCADDDADVNADARNVLSSCTVLPISPHRAIWIQMDFRLGFFLSPRRDAGRIARALVVSRITE